MAAKTELVDKSEVINAKDVVDVTETTLTVFTPLVIQPIEAGYLELSERYVEIRTRLHELVDSVKDVEVTEEYLSEAAVIQKEVNSLWNEIETARKNYHKFVDSVLYDPIASKIEQEIKVKFQEWERTFKASKTEIDNQLLEKRVNDVSVWFKKEATDQGLDWLTLQDALNQRAVNITRKNKSSDIVKAANAFIDKVRSDIAVLRDGYGDEEIAEYRKTFNAATAIATVKARKAEIDVAKQITVEPEAPLVQEIVAPQEPQVQADGRMTRVWELTGTKEQLIKLARTALNLGIEYKVLGGS